jgi:acyl-coenzyme A thioesterase PaaI-like protein
MDEQTPQERASPGTRARVRDGFARQGLMAHLGARITRIAPGRVHIEQAIVAGFEQAIRAAV